MTRDDPAVVKRFPTRPAKAQSDQGNLIDQTFQENISRNADDSENDSLLITIMMTDVVNSTEIIARLGDAKWRDIMDCLDAAAIRTVARHDGSLIKLMGDGLLAAFPRPSAAIACAREFQAEAKKSGLKIRTGVHAGECLRTVNDVTGIAIAIAARVLSLTPGGHVWVSSTVRDLVLGSGLEFSKVGPKTLKGLSEEWVLYQLAEEDTA
ncbi:adenylate/guanylate cyclase domain-containing protein [Ruegeria arenilitoris]|uniref:adenylate/guanylate cyclase domain-containing protein n=1 Tax=Ruegeria arenilitoris TaxID=1173585 RepID=UPI001481323A|nr:adenylate/guanylate cyclase domain-containing protein [Ruegeria arenilitoris]